MALRISRVVTYVLNTGERARRTGEVRELVLAGWEVLALLGAHSGDGQGFTQDLPGEFYMNSYGK